MIWTIFAYILNGKVVGKGVFMHGRAAEADKVCRISFGNDAYVVDVTQYPVEEGDTYEDGEFYRVIDKVKTKIEYIPTVEEQVDINSEAIDDIIIAITPTGV